MNVLALALLIELRRYSRRVRRRLQVARAWVELLALYVQGALPRETP